MDAKKIVLVSMILMIGISSLSMVTAGLFGPDTQEVTVNGTNFVLDGSIKITGQNGDLVNFALKDGITGFLTNIPNEDALNSYIQNDTELGYAAFEVTSAGDIKEYGFVEDGIDKGYFILFQKNDNNFVYYISTDINAADNDVKEIASSMTDFIENNKDIKPI